MSETTNVCPACGSGKVVIQLMDSDDAGAECVDCGWKGVRRDCVAVAMPQNPLSFGLDEDAAMEIAKTVSKDFMRLLSQHASTPIGLCLIESGMVSRNDTQALTRMLRATCLGAHKAALDEAEKMAAEHKQLAHDIGQPS